MDIRTSKRLGLFLRSLKAVLGTRWDTSSDLGTDIATIINDVDATQQAINGIPVSIQATYTGSLSNGGSATIIALDATIATIRNIRVKVWISGATAALGITPGWFVTTYAAPTTFVQQTVPSQGAQHILAAAVIEDYEVGDLPKGLQGELRIASNGNDSGLTFEATIAYDQ